MVGSDLLIGLVKFGMSGDKQKFQKVVESLIADERNKQHKILADNLEDLLKIDQLNKPISNGTGVTDQRIGSLIHEIIPSRKLDDLILPENVYQVCQEVIQEQNRSELLRSYNLEPRNRILLIGPPGNGKTSLAEAIAEGLMVPLFIVRYEGVIGTYLGETAVRLRRLIDYASTRKCVLFFDEFETLGKERGDTHETGEIKRVVSSLLMQIDTLPSHVIVIGATNHAELLDRAVWRRFQIRMNLPEPTRERLAKWFEKYEKRFRMPLGYAPMTLAKKLLSVKTRDINFSEAEEFGTTIFRRYVLDQPNSDMKSIIDRTLIHWKNKMVKTDQQNGGKNREIRGR